MVLSPKMNSKKASGWIISHRCRYTAH